MAHISCENNLGFHLVLAPASMYLLPASLVATQKMVLDCTANLEATSVSSAWHDLLDEICSQSISDICSYKLQGL